MKEIAKIIFHKNNKVLLQLRDDDPTIPFPGMWTLFGGGIEVKETPKECVLREVKEELSIKLNRVNFITRQKRYESSELAKDYIFSSKLKQNFGNLELKEGQDMQLFSKSELKKIDLVSHYSPIIKGFLTEISK
ncbi:MAG: NUDIX domain-containing protein [Candidatus Magasanikbacteria bacterium]